MKKIINQPIDRPKRISQETNGALQKAIEGMCTAFAQAQDELGPRYKNLDIVYTRPSGEGRSYHVMILDLGAKN